MNKILDILDSCEEIRRNAENNPAAYPTDYTIRLIEAIVAGAFGYKDRNQWTDELKNTPESRYHAWYGYLLPVVIK